MVPPRGTDLTRYFPDLVPVLVARLPADVCVDAEVVCWDVDKGRLDFAALGRRLTAGRRLASVAKARPAHLVCFDLLAAAGVDLRPTPLAGRRERLEQLLSGMAAPIALCQQTEDPVVAQQWMDTMPAAGIEGLVLKDLRDPYPTRPGIRLWHKLKARAALDLVVVGVVGDPRAPSALLLARPEQEGLRPVGVTTTLSRALSREARPAAARSPRAGPASRGLARPTTNGSSDRRRTHGGRGDR